MLVVLLVMFVIGASCSPLVLKSMYFFGHTNEIWCSGSPNRNEFNEYLSLYLDVVVKIKKKSAFKSKHIPQYEKYPIMQICFYLICTQVHCILVFFLFQDISDYISDLFEVLVFKSWKLMTVIWNLNYTLSGGSFRVKFSSGNIFIIKPKIRHIWLEPNFGSAAG